MLTPKENERLTLTGPGTPCGDLMRRYWQPVALSSELAPFAPIATRLMGEDLVLFRDQDGLPGLLGRTCPHRGVDLSFGRCEDGGLRCVYHGWLLARDGRVLEQPGEPAESSFKNRVRQKAYPCVEKNGLILAYLGPGEPPAFPTLPYFELPTEQVWATRIVQECNYLQGLEGDVDPQHLSFLHRFFNLAPDAVRESTTFTAMDPSPEILVEDTTYGFRIYAVRDAGDATRYVRVTNFVMPNNSAFAAGQPVDPAIEKLPRSTHYRMHWHVPIDDVTHWKYEMCIRLDGPVDTDYLHRVFPHQPGEPLERNLQNRYLQDRTEQRTRTFTGIGTSFNDHDRLATESMGPIFDRSGEHLGATDRGVTLLRKMLLRAVDDVAAGRDPLAVQRAAQPDAYDGLVVIEEIVPHGRDVHGFWKSEVSA
jgi:phenylpropionate dioxygenase-like ring-hydroxylating dioxygenase large terminal subunit